MRIKCKNCGCLADGVDVSSHLGSCLLKAFGTAAVSYFTKLLMASVMSPTRSILDDSMAVVANISEMKCSKCDKTGLWKSFPVVEKSSKTMKNDASQEV